MKTLLQIRAMLSEWANPGLRSGLSRDELVSQLEEATLGCAELEKLIQLGPPLASDPALPLGQLISDLPLSCAHLDYETSYFLYLPSHYRADQRWPLMVVGHGGNSRMAQSYARMAALGGIKDWISLAEEHGYILAAPLTERGWAGIGYSIVFSLLSQLQRKLAVDPNRIYITGHSMGGHLAWRSALLLGDRWAAVSPMSGGYDYVAKDMMPLLQNAPGYATFGKREPYGIHEANRRMQDWLADHPLDWQIVEKPGGHEIFPDELPHVMDFFDQRERNLFPDQVWAQSSRRQSWSEPDTGWEKVHRWHKDRPIPKGIFYWLRLHDHLRLPEGKWQKVAGKIDRENNILSLQGQHVHRLTVYLHPRLVWLDQTLRVEYNGQTIFEERVEPDLRVMLDLLRETDDWGRTYWTKLELHDLAPLV